MHHTRPVSLCSLAKNKHSKTKIQVKPRISVFLSANCTHCRSTHTAVIPNPQYGYLLYNISLYFISVNNHLRINYMTSCIISNDFLPNKYIKCGCITASSYVTDHKKNFRLSIGRKFLGKI